MMREYTVVINLGKELQGLGQSAHALALPETTLRFRLPISTNAPHTSSPYGCALSTVQKKKNQQGVFPVPQNILTHVEFTTYLA